MVATPSINWEIKSTRRSGPEARDGLIAKCRTPRPQPISPVHPSFRDLRTGQTTQRPAIREGKEAHFAKPFKFWLSSPPGAQPKRTRACCSNTGKLTETGLRRTADGGLNASGSLTGPEHAPPGSSRIVLEAYFGAGFHHPHLRERRSRLAAERVHRGGRRGPSPVLRAIAWRSAQRGCFSRDYRIVPR